jgi:putative membrane protein
LWLSWRSRLIHFAFGLLWVLPVWEVCVRYFKVSRRVAFYVAFEFVLAFSALYELFEWGLTMVLSPHDADAYNDRLPPFRAGRAPGGASCDQR